ncbi:MAG TPA: hypothetical protein VK508_12505 [Cyclobacteriaceae bacterium]|nr:hypothetical protein [Cyclobacteriaceae bacterium]
MKVAFLLLLTITGYAQSGFYTRTIDFSSEANARWEHPPFENLGTMLLDAYLRGQLKAYQFNVAHDVVKYAPLPKDEMPAVWDPNLDYYQEDMVFHKGKVYIVNVDLIHGSAPPDDSQVWQGLDMHGPAVSIRHHFPAAADTTTKSFLLSHLVEEAPASYDPWSEGMEYFNNDRVEYNGQMFEARADNFAGITPGTNENFWRHFDSRLIMFQPADLNIINILYHYEVKGNDTIQTPQMLSVMVMDPYREVFRNVGLNFFYADVAKHLASSRLPALYLSDIGRVGGGAFLFDEHTKENFVRWVLSKIVSKEIKPDKKTILNETEYTLFINTKPEDINHINWYPVQNPATHDITIFAGKLNTDYDYFTIPALSIPFKSIEKLLKALPPPEEPKSYTGIFSQSFLSVTSMDTVAMDSIEALPMVATAYPAFTETSFEEIHFDYVDATPLLQNTIPVLWNVIASSAGKVKFQPGRSYYPCDCNWTGTLIKFSMGSQVAGKDFTLSQVSPPPSELPKAHWKLKEAGVVYRIDQSGKYAPVQVVISFEDEPHSDLIDYRVDWNDVIKLLSGKNEFAEFISGAQKATLNFKQTAITYCLTNK